MTRSRSDRTFLPSVTRIADLETEPFDVFRLPRNEWRNGQYVVVEIDSERFPLARDELLEVLTAENVLARRYFWPGCHRMEPYRTLFPDAGRHLPRTEEVAGRVLLLPNGTAIGPEHVEGICRLITRAAHHAEPLREHLAARSAQPAGAVAL